MPKAALSLRPSGEPSLQEPHPRAGNPPVVGNSPGSTARKPCANVQRRGAKSVASQITGVGILHILTGKQTLLPFAKLIKNRIYPDSYAYQVSLVFIVLSFT